MEKLILDSDLDADQSQNLIDYSLAEDLSFHKIWFKSVNSFMRYPADRYTHTDRDITLPLQLLSGNNALFWVLFITHEMFALYGVHCTPL